MKLIIFLFIALNCSAQIEGKWMVMVDYNWAEVEKIYKKDMGFDPGFWAIKNQTELIINYIIVEISEDGTLRIVSFMGENLGIWMATKEPYRFEFLIEYNGKPRLLNGIFFNGNFLQLLSDDKDWKYYLKGSAHGVFLKRINS